MKKLNNFKNNKIKIKKDKKMIQMKIIIMMIMMKILMIKMKCRMIRIIKNNKNKSILRIQQSKNYQKIKIK